MFTFTGALVLTVSEEKLGLQVGKRASKDTDNSALESQSDIYSFASHSDPTENNNTSSADVHVEFPTGMHRHMHWTKKNCVCTLYCPLTHRLSIITPLFMYADG